MISFTSSCTVLKPTQKDLVVTEPVKELFDTTDLSAKPITQKLTFAAGDPILPNIDKLVAAPSYEHIPPTFYPITRPTQKMRNDSQGDGHFGASRGRRRHNGLDIIVTPGSAVYCPIEGLMKRVAHPYGGRRNKKWLGCAIEGTGLYRGYEVKIFYMDPFLMGEYVYPNDIVGKAQAISKKYTSRMIDHLHVEVRYKGMLVNPATLFNLIK